MYKFIIILPVYKYICSFYCFLLRDELSKCSLCPATYCLTFGRVIFWYTSLVLKIEWLHSRVSMHTVLKPKHPMCNKKYKPDFRFCNYICGLEFKINFAIGSCYWYIILLSFIWIGQEWLCRQILFFLFSLKPHSWNPTFSFLFALKPHACNQESWI